MNQAQDKEAEDLLSHDRLQGFRLKAGANTDRDLLGRYLHNVAISMALYPHLHALEVVLRNRIFAAVDRDHPIDRDRRDLYRDFPCWLDATPALLIGNHQPEIERAKADVRKDLRRRFRSDRESQDPKKLTPGRLVAKLTFGFWVYLFDPGYTGAGRGQQGILWPRYSKAVFPGRDDVGVTDVRKMLRRLLVVRNRVMHYERIAPWQDYESSALRPERVRDDILQLLEWMSPRAGQTAREYGPDNFYSGPLFGRFLRRFAARPF